MHENFVLKKVSAQSPLLEKVVKLFQTSFPVTERVTLSPFYDGRHDGAELYAYTVAEDVAAFFCTLTGTNFYYLFYIAVDPHYRRQGLGTRILDRVKKTSNGMTIFLDCEAIYPGCKNEETRLKRINFYERNGFRTVGQIHEWRGEKFMTMVYGGLISNEEIDSFWEEFEHLWEESISI